MLEAGKDGSAVFVNERFPEDLRDRLREIAIDLLGKKAKARNGLAIRATSLAGASFSQRLTLRQNQIVGMLKIGSSNREIAHVLGLSEGTIKVHLHGIMAQTPPG
jgi:two-component system nitrate/nitrite response regulator NarL